MKKRILAVLCTMTAAGAVLAVPTAAQAADPYPKVVVNVSSGGADVFFNTMTPPADLKVHVRKKGTTTRVATVTDLTPRDNCADGCEDPESPVLSRSFVTGPLKLADLAEYAIDVEYDGTEGETVLHEDKAVLNYRLRPVFENVKSSNQVSLAKRDTVVSGDLKLRDPRDGSLKPFAGATVTRVIGTVATPVVADAQGHFESKVTLTGSEPIHEDHIDYGWYHVHVDLAAELNGVKAVAAAEPGVDTMRARITLDSTTQTGAYGTRGKISGAVTWRTPDGTYKPAPAGMKISTGPTSAVTDASGRFASSPLFVDDAPWKVVESSPWLYGSGPQVTVNTTGGSRFSDFKASVDQNKTVSVNARFERAQIPAGTTSLKVEVQHSADGKTGWTTRKSMNVTTKPGANTVALIETTLPYPGAGYVRLRHAGTAGIHGSVTPAVKTARTMTAIPDFNVSPEPVRHNRTITVTGKLTHADPTWKPFAGQKVAIYFLPAGSTTWRKREHGATTTADGTFTQTYTADVTGSWTARYEETAATHFFAESRVDEVIVNP
ncbi:hypothetical protein ACIQV3_28530 [Streptomyces sp. NPDC099050]|uniref:hypothetical protein n=1 Tax=Streptomyces sp. NPDC099050 TaxID=3366100 RepID=UPI00381B3811